PSGRPGRPPDEPGRIPRSGAGLHRRAAGRRQTALLTTGARVEILLDDRLAVVPVLLEAGHHGPFARIEVKAHMATGQGTTVAGFAGDRQVRDIDLHLAISLAFSGATERGAFAGLVDREVLFRGRNRSHRVLGVE